MDYRQVFYDHIRDTYRGDALITAYMMLLRNSSFCCTRYSD